MPNTGPNSPATLLRAVIFIFLFFRVSTAQENSDSPPLLEVAEVGQRFELSLPTAHEGLGRSTLISLKNSTGKQVRDLKFNITCKCLSVKTDVREIEPGDARSIEFRFIPTSGSYSQSCEIVATIEEKQVSLCEIGFRFKVEQPVAPVPNYVKSSDLRRDGLSFVLATGRPDIRIELETLRVLSDEVVLIRDAPDNIQIRLKPEKKNIERIPFHVTFFIKEVGFDYRFFIDVVGDNKLRIEPSRLRLRSLDTVYRSRFIARHLPVETELKLSLSTAKKSASEPNEQSVEKSGNLSNQIQIKKIFTKSEFTVFELTIDKALLDTIVRVNDDVELQVSCGESVFSLPLDF